MIQISLLDGKALVWRAEDAREIRENHGLVGNLVGCLARKPRQNVRLGLPLQLLPEEARLLADIGAGVLVTRASVRRRVSNDLETVSAEEGTESEDAGGTGIPDREDPPRPEQEVYQQHLEESYQGQRVLALQERRRLLESLSEQITQGRAKRKPARRQPAGRESETEFGDALYERSSVSAADRSCLTTEDPLGSPPQGPLQELQNLEETFHFPREAMMVHLPTARLPLRQEEEEVVVVDWHRPSPDWPHAGQKDHEVRYRVFRDLWERGYFLTSGSKFGGDFLVYPGDPMRFHAHFITLCFSQEEQIPLSDIVTAGRLGTNVKKTVLLCSVNGQGRVSYTSLQWSGLQ